MRCDDRGHSLCETRRCRSPPGSAGGRCWQPLQTIRKPPRTGFPSRRRRHWQAIRRSGFSYTTPPCARRVGGVPPVRSTPRRRSFSGVRQGADTTPCIPRNTPDRSARLFRIRLISFGCLHASLCEQTSGYYYNRTRDGRQLQIRHRSQGKESG